VIKRIFLLLICFLLFLTAAPALGKGPAGKITIVGPGLADPLEITDLETREQFSPWSRNFLAPGREGPAATPSLLSAYQVFFYVENALGAAEIRYTYYYVPGRAGRAGTIYLPGEEEEWYRVNTGTIIRAGDDGQWRYASEAWDALMREHLPEAIISPGPILPLLPVLNELSDGSQHLPI
jgi:hypothetical protein